METGIKYWASFSLLFHYNTNAHSAAWLPHSMESI